MYQYPSNYSSHQLTLRLEDGGANRRIAEKFSNGVRLSKLFKPLTVGRLPKLYVIVVSGVIHYVGYSHMKIGSRLGYGFSPNHDSGYHGYKWVKENLVDMWVFCFGEAEIVGEQELKDAKHFFEAVEAELAYLVRNKTGRWPESQNEIHFNNGNLDDARKLAAQIYTEVV